jgi:hypothetical protein
MTTDMEAALAGIEKRESGGQNIYTAQHATNPTGYTASGYYQIIDPTWREGAGMAGVDTSQYPTAISAPFDVQHQVALALYSKYGAKPWAASEPHLGNLIANGQPAPQPTPPPPPATPLPPGQAAPAAAPPMDPALLDAMYSGTSVAGGPSSLADAFARAARAGQQQIV